MRFIGCWIDAGTEKEDLFAGWTVYDIVEKVLKKYYVDYLIIEPTPSCQFTCGRVKIFLQLTGEYLYDVIHA